MTPEELSRALREGSSPALRRRRAIAALSLCNVFSMGVISLYQMGIVKHVPEPPVPGADADRINGSAQAYEILDTPDATLGVCSYGVTLALAAMAEPERARTRPWAPLAMAGKAVLDAVFALKLLRDQPVKYRAYCMWCVLSALATLAVVPLAWPEAGEAVVHLRSRKGQDETVEATP